MSTGTLADEFLADLEEDNIQQEQEKKQIKEENNNKMEEENNQIDEMVIENITFNDVKEISKLITSEKLKNLLQRIEEKMKFISSFNNWNGPVEQNPEYKLVVESNTMTVEIQNEILKIYKFVKEKYKKRFPELENLVLNPLDYIKTIVKIKNSIDLVNLNFDDILPPATVMVVRLTATTTQGKPLELEELEKVLIACDLILKLDESRQKIVSFVESRMSFIAPNLSAIVGSDIAAKLMTAAGGITTLSKMPSCNLQLLGTNKKQLGGFSNAIVKAGTGFLNECELVVNSPPSLRKSVVRLVAGKCTLAARVDSFHEDPTGRIGRQFRSEIEKKIEKFLEPPPAKLPKPLPAPDDKPRKKRGGKRMRKIKQKYEMTDLRKAANRIPFGLTKQDTIGLNDKPIGMLGGTGTGKIKINVTEKGIIKKQKQIKYGSSGATSGLSSSLAFTPVQGLELMNPEAAQQKIKEANLRYFGQQKINKITSTNNQNNQ